MSRPTPYNRFTNFTTYALNNSTNPYNPADHDAEFNAIELSLDETIAVLNGITRSDGKLANASVSIDTLTPEVFLSLTATNGGWRIRGQWLTGQVYEIGDVVKQGVSTCVCAIAHVSGVFATDLASGKWMLINQAVLNAAGQIPLSLGGTQADLSATGGPKMYLKQPVSGGAVEVGVIAGSDIVGPVDSVKKNSATISFGNSFGMRNATANIADASVTTNSKISASVESRVGDSIGDELEMDGFVVAGKCLTDGQVRFDVQCVTGFASGQYVINYIVEN